MNQQKSLILLKAGELFWRKGYDKTTMRDIANACAMTPGNLYHYFSNKEDILFSVLHDELNQLVLLVKPLKDEHAGDPITRLRKFILYHCNFTLGEIRRLGMLFDLEMKSLTGENLEIIKTLRDSYENVLSTIIRQGKDIGVFGNVDEKLACYFIASIISRSRLWFSPKGKYSAAEVANYIFDFALTGIKYGIVPT